MTITTDNGKYSIHDDGTECGIDFEKFDGSVCRITTRDRGSLLAQNIVHVLSLYGNGDVSDLSWDHIKEIYQAVYSNIGMMGRKPLCGDTEYVYARRTNDGSRMFRVSISDNGDGTWTADADGVSVELQDGMTPDDLLSDLSGGKRMEGFRLFDYQKAAVEATEGMWEKDGKQRLLIELPTGTGKTVVVSELIKKELERGGKVLMLAHTKDLIDQAKKSLSFHMPDAEIGIERGENKVKDVDGPDIVIASMQSMDRRKGNYPENHFTLVVVDEAHHTACKSYIGILARFPDAKVLGVTATPERTDKNEKTKKIYEATSYRLSLKDAIEKEYLSPIKVLRAGLEIDLSGVKRDTKNDYETKSVENRLTGHFETIAKTMTKNVRNRRPAVFLPSVETAKKFAEILGRNGWNPIEIDGKTPDRKQKLDDFRDGRYDVIVSVDALREGFDCPSVDCIVPLRPTTSPIVYKQMIGRGTRLCPERVKRDCLILDFLWKDNHPGLFRSTDIFAENEEERVWSEYLLNINRKVGKAISLTALAEKVKAEIEAIRHPKPKLIKKEMGETKRDRSLLNGLNRLYSDTRGTDPVSGKDVSWKLTRKLFKPLEYCYLTGIRLSDLDSSGNKNVAWKYPEASVTDGQKKALRAAGIDPDSVRTWKKASSLINFSKQRLDNGLASVWKLARLKYVHGFDERVEGWSDKAAKMMLDECRKAGIGQMDKAEQDKAERWLVNRLRSEYMERNRRN